MSTLVARNRLGYGLDMSKSAEGVDFFAPDSRFDAKFSDHFDLGSGDYFFNIYHVTNGYKGAELTFEWAHDEATDDHPLRGITLSDRPWGEPANLITWFVELPVPIGASYSTYVSDENFNGLSGDDLIRGNDFRDVVKADSGADDVIGRGADRLHGESGDDRLYGGKGDDRLSGGAEWDFLDGGKGKDRLTGGEGADVFNFRSVADGGLGEKRDMILDFESGMDRIRLDKTDADVTEVGDQAFEFIGADRYGGEAGELRFRAGLLAGDVDGDGKSDFQIEIGNVAPLTEANILL